MSAVSQEGRRAFRICGGRSSAPTTTDSRDMYQSSILPFLLSSATICAKWPKPGKDRRRLLLELVPWELWRLYTLLREGMTLKSMN